MNFKQFLLENSLVLDYLDRWDKDWYLLDINKDSFIHFSPKDRIDQIVKANRLLMHPPYKKFGIDAISAISTTYGKLVPGVQTTHLKRNMEDLGAILFKTSIIPERGYPDEVNWHEDVIFSSVKVISMEDAVEMLSNTPFDIGEDGIVIYDKNQMEKYKRMEK